MINKPNFSSTYAKGVISLFKGNFWAQAFGLLGTLFIANLYGSDIMGVFSKFISISSVLAIFFTIRLESAFVLTKDEKNLKTIFSSIVYSILVGTIISAVIILLLPDSFYSQVNFLRVYAVFCVFGAVLKSLENVFLSYLLRLKFFSKIAFSRILFTLTKYGAQFALFTYLIDLGLIIGFLIGTFIILVYFYLITGNLFSFISFSEFKRTIRENYNLVSFGVLSDNLNAINLNLIPILAGVYFSDAEIGWYFLAMVLLSVPVTFINASFSKVFFLRASEIYNDNPSALFSFVKKYTTQLSLGLLLPFLAIFFLSTPFIEVALKDEWITVGLYIQLLAVLFYLRSIYNPLSYLEEVLKKNHLGLIFNSFLFVVNVTAIVYGGMVAKDFLTTLYIIAIGLPIGYLSMIIYFLMVTKQLNATKSE
jgi:O-antigen/teichoic acid export membrane protein